MSIYSKPKSFFGGATLILAAVTIFMIYNCGDNGTLPNAADGGTATADGGPHDGGIHDGGIRDGGPRPDGGINDGGTPEDGGPDAGYDGGPDGGDAGIPDGGCDGIALLLINEENQKIIYDQDLIELKVIRCGIMNDILVQLNPGVSPTKGKLTLATISNLMVAEGDIIVIHLGPNPDGGELVVSETNISGKNSCPTSAGCYNNAWDIKGIMAGIPNTERVIAVGPVGGDGGMGLIQDAVPFVSDSSPSENFLEALHWIQNNGQWLPADCDGGLCTNSSNPTASSICVDWSVCTSNKNRSMQRKAAADTNRASDWQFSGDGGSSWGQ